ncbi:MAG TPA: DUF6790 family protein [Bacteroidota bacterium]|nr:DUF6790 family protein [Bacteroidota bacterium]
MFILMIIALMFVFPALSILVEMAVFRSDAGFVFLMGKWFVFWGVGIRLFSAGLRQSLQPRFTAEQIFGISDPEPRAIVRELGFANLSIGVLGIISLLNGMWILPSAIAGGVFYGLAGAQHAVSHGRNRLENAAMISDIFMCIVLVFFCCATFSH